MGSVEARPRQLGFKGHIFDAKGNGTLRVLQPLLTAAEQISLIDERIKREIPELRIVKKGKVILVPSQNGCFTRVFLEQDAILYREPQKGRPKRFNYFNRIPVLVKSVEYGGNPWQKKQGELFDTFSQQRKIPKKLMPKVISLLRPYAK